MMYNTANIPHPNPHPPASYMFPVCRHACVHEQVRVQGCKSACLRGGQASESVHACVCAQACEGVEGRWGDACVHAWVSKGAGEHVGMCVGVHKWVRVRACVWACVWACMSKNARVWACARCVHVCAWKGAGVCVCVHAGCMSECGHVGANCFKLSKEIEIKQKCIGAKSPLVCEHMYMCRCVWAFTSKCVCGHCRHEPLCKKKKKKLTKVKNYHHWNVGVHACLCVGVWVCM